MDTYDDEVYDLADRGDDRPGLEDADLDEFDDDFDEDDELDEEDDLDDEDDYLDLEDVTDEEIDCIVALWREDGVPQAAELDRAGANDLDVLIEELRRIPGDGGALGMVAINGEFFVLCRVRGEHVQVLLSDLLAAVDYPLAHDVADFLDEDVDDLDDDEESAPLGDVDMLADLGIAEFDLEQTAANVDDNPVDLLELLATRLGMGEQFGAVVG